MTKGTRFSHLLIAFGFLFLMGNAPLQAQMGTWAVSAGGGLQDYAEDVVVDDAGNAYILGYFRDTVRFGSHTLAAMGQTDIYLAKYDVDGNPVWARSYGWYANEFAHGLTLDQNGNVVFVGEYQDSTIFDNDTLWSLDTLWYGPPAKTYDVFYCTVDPNGNMLDVFADGWFGSENYFDIVTDSRNYLITVGLFRTFNDFGGNFYGIGYDEAFLVVKDPNNPNFEFKVQAMGKFIDMATSLDVIGDSLYIMGGMFQDTCWFADTCWFQPTACVGGDTTVYRITDFEDDVFVVAHDSSGEYRWVQTGGGPGKDRLDATICDAAGNIYVAGHYDSTFTMDGITINAVGELDGFLAKLDMNGNVQWLQSYGGEGFDAIRDISLMDNGNLVIGGYFQGSMDVSGTTLTGVDSIDQEAFAIALTPAGNVLWTVSGGGNSIEVGRAVDVDASGHTYLFGTFNGTARFGQRSLTAAGSDDLFLLRIAPDGAVALEPAPEAGALTGFEAYPNPTTDRVTIGFHLERPADVSIQLLDLQGRVVRQIAQDRRFAPGDHKMSGDLSGLDAGVYFYRIDAGARPVSGKLILMR